jgi:ubiquinone/menaquinone biosynthesis C-methylase UbiE
MSTGIPPVRRLPHASLDADSRWRKATKIARLLQIDRTSGPLRVLEIGCGSGVIASYFAALETPSCEVHAIDVTDQRIVCEGFHFVRVGGPDLPYRNGSFDLVISNHVIEHVGEREAQHRHLAEIARVLRPSGTVYLAAPNRWMLVEPHYRLAFLSWLPRSWRSPYLKLSRKGLVYDCNPLSARQLEALFQATGFNARSLIVPALSEMVTLEPQKSRMAKLLRRLPTPWLEWISPWSPTLIYQLTPTRRTHEQ